MVPNASHVLLGLRTTPRAHSRLTPTDSPNVIVHTVAGLLDILVHSLYSDRDVFFRELISNAADALDKRRFLSLQEPAQAGNAVYEITINADPESRMLRIRDTGIGMDEAELRTNLGVIAKSGTAAFLENLASEGASGVSQIGQFGTLRLSLD